MLHSSPVFKKRMRGSLYEIGALLAICNSVIVFFIGTFSESLGITGFQLASLYAVGSIISLVGFVALPYFIAAFTARRVLIATSTLYTLGVFATAAAHSFYSLLVPFTLVSLTFGIMLALLDIYVEHSTDTSHTEGDVRGLYLALQNAAYILGPFVGGLVLTMGGYSALFIASAAFMVPAIGIIYERLGSVTPPPPHTHPSHRTRLHAHVHHAGLSLPHLTTIWHNRMLREVYTFYFLLRIFFALFGIHVAIYLSTVHSFSFATIGTLIAIALIPMVAVEMPVGHLLGRAWHHSHVGMVGFGIIALTCSIIPFIDSHSFTVWALLLFTMRIGASLVEIVAETYFFSLAGHDAQKVGLFRATYPLSFIIGPALGSSAIYLAGYNGMFMLLASLSLVGAYIASEFKDTRHLAR